MGNKGTPLVIFVVTFIQLSDQNPANFVVYIVGDLKYYPVRDYFISHKAITRSGFFQECQPRSRSSAYAEPPTDQSRVRAMQQVSPPEVGET